MELRHLRVFVAVAEELHFGRAAIRLHLTQPAVSGHIRQLERELGVRLLERSTRQAALTEAGAAFLQDARRIVSRADAATISVRSWRKGASPRLRVGYIEDGFPRELPIALRRLVSTAGAPQIQLTSAQPEDLIAQVRDGTLDAAIVSLPAPVSDLWVETFVHEDAAVAVSAAPLGRRDDEITLEIVAQGIVLTRPRRMNPGFHDAALAAFRTAGIPSPLLELEGVCAEQLLLQVAAGAGMALVPRSVADRFRVPGVELRRLAFSSRIGCDIALVASELPTRAPLGVFLDALHRSSAQRTAPPMVRAAA
jgi:DNA-binding transcriptional LysR family regulator